MESLGQEYDIQFYSLQEVDKAPKSDFSFELFYGGRAIHDFRKVIFNNKDTIVLVSDHMHGNHLDQVRGPNFELYFKPPGLGEVPCSSVFQAKVRLF